MDHDPFRKLNLVQNKDKKMTRHVHHVFGLGQWCNFSRNDFRVFIHAYLIIVEYDIKRKYPEEYQTVHKVKEVKNFYRGNPFSPPPISKQARVNAILRAFLLNLKVYNKQYWLPK